MNESLRRLTEMQANQAAVNAALLDVLSRLASEKPSLSAADLLEQFAQKQASLSVGIGNSQEIPITIGQKVTLSPKLDFAIEYLKKHPDERQKSGRDLESSVTMNGETISYKWWNKAKNLL